MSATIDEPVLRPYIGGADELTVLDDACPLGSVW